MRQKIAMWLAIAGLIIIALAFMATGRMRMAGITLGIIIACGGCLMMLAGDHYSAQHRLFLIVITILFVLLIIGYVIKVTTLN